MSVPEIALPAALALGASAGLVGYLVHESRLARRLPHIEGGGAIRSGPPVSGSGTPASAEVKDLLDLPAAAVPSAQTLSTSERAVPPMSPSDAADRIQTRLEQLTSVHLKLADCLEALVDFADGAPRRARAASCVTVLTRLVPEPERTVSLQVFLAVFEAGVNPLKLQALAAPVALEMAVTMRRSVAEAASLRRLASVGERPQVDDDSTTHEAGGEDGEAD